MTKRELPVLLNKAFSREVARLAVRKTVSLMLALFLAFTGYIHAVNHLIKATSSSYIIDKSEACSRGFDCIMVLGAGVDGNGDPGYTLSRRLETGVSLYSQGASDRLLMSGDHGRIGYDEVNAMKDYAVSQGVVPKRVFMDHAGFSTYESMYRARDVFAVESMVIVSQKYHLYRAVYIARALGIDAYGVACNKSEGSGLAALDIREFLARNKDFWYYNDR